MTGGRAFRLVLQHAFGVPQFRGPRVQRLERQRSDVVRSGSSLDPKECSAPAVTHHHVRFCTRHARERVRIGMIAGPGRQAQTLHGAAAPTIHQTP